jgi:hypothetical protein
VDQNTLVPFLDAEIDRMREMKRGAKPRPALAIVAGTDMEGANGIGILP